MKVNKRFKMKSHKITKLMPETKNPKLIEGKSKYLRTVRLQA